MIGRTFSSTKSPTVSRTSRCSSVRSDVEIEVIRSGRQAGPSRKRRHAIPEEAPGGSGRGRSGAVPGYTFATMSAFLGGSAYAMVRDIADGYIIASELTFKKFQPAGLPDLRLRARQAAARDPGQRPGDRGRRGDAEAPAPDAAAAAGAHDRQQRARSGSVEPPRPGPRGAAARPSSPRSSFSPHGSDDLAAGGASLDDAMTDIWDAKLNAWILQWDFHQTFHDPLQLFELNFFYPARDVLAFSENLWGVSLFGFPLLAAGASPLANYNVLLLLGMFLSALGGLGAGARRDRRPDRLGRRRPRLRVPAVALRQLPHLQFQWARVSVLCRSSSSCGTSMAGAGARRGSLRGVLRVERALQRALRVLRRASRRGRARRFDAPGPRGSAAMARRAARRRGGRARLPALRAAVPRGERALRHAPLLGRGAGLLGTLDGLSVRRRTEPALRPADEGAGAVRKGTSSRGSPPSLLAAFAAGAAAPRPRSGRRRRRRPRRLAGPGCGSRSVRSTLWP